MASILDMHWDISVGLEIHESPNFSPREETVIRPGMVITVEPASMWKV